MRAHVPQQPQGESIAFTENGDLLIASEAREGPVPPIQALPGAVSRVQQQARTETVADEASAHSSGTLWGIGIAGGAVVLVVGAGFLVRRRAR
ncbi:hypothetical protein [Rhodococcus opacus]|uniref:hypothetical protein n=1 Tax=Rhodococcus opacus TaxID=37919 RepID=UPI0021C81DDB|nr:hypothetical protein [Rhodococcus opacus]